jgi:hypothetical protein
VTLLWTLIVPIGIASAVPIERLPASKAAAIESAFIENSISIQPPTPYGRQIELEMNCAFMFAGKKKRFRDARLPAKIVHVRP